MTQGLEINIDLETGDALIRKEQSFPPSHSASRDWTVKEGKLGQADLVSLRRTVEQSLAEGLRSKTCNEEDQKNAVVRWSRSGVATINPPIIRSVTPDAIIKLDVRWNGREGHAPEIQCHGQAFDRLWQAAYDHANILR